MNKLWRIKRSKTLLLFLFSLAAVGGTMGKPIAISYGNWLAAGESKPTGDMSVLLSGSNARLIGLIELYERDRVQSIYYAAGIDENVEDLQGYRDIFASYDLPTEDLYCGELVASTFNEAQAFKRKLAEIKHPVNKIVLVSDRYHLRRGIWSFNRVLGDEVEITAFAIDESSEATDPEWWKHQYSRDYVISETKKMAFYWIYYGLLNRSKLITHGDMDRIIHGKKKEGVKHPCEIVLPQSLEGS